MVAGEHFDGVIGTTIHESTPHWPEPPRPRTGAPNVVIILIDDLGFSHFSCFGSTLETPHIDALAAGGIRYTNYHVTPLCSPTRAALLTGRNAHEVGMRSVSNFNTGFPNMRGCVSHHAGTVAEVLRENGYATFAVGKWHLTQMENASAAGPFDQWPLGRGFDRFYGFLDGETDQFHPELIYDNHHIPVPKTVEEGYHLSEDLVDQGLHFIRDLTSIRPDKPFFTYLAFGATHAPHQAPQSYLDKHRGRYDSGWDVARDEWFARQKDMGIIPADTQLAPRNPGVEPWDELPDNQRRLALRLQEAFAAFLEHTDEQIGRFIAELDRLGKLDNTLIFLQSDNGASQEGGPFGVMHEMKFFNLIIESPDEAVQRIDDIGGPHSHANYPWGWAQAGNTPFKWYKQNTHEGGVHVPLIVHWPQGISDRGSLRDQFHVVNDIVPTIYEIVGVETPAMLKGFEQMPITGTSLAYSFNSAHTPSTKSVQYFENMGHRAIYADGWKAVTRHESGVSYDDDVWELYNLEIDRSECNDLSALMPEKLQHMIALWWDEARAHNVLPLDDRGVALFGARLDDHGPHRHDRHYTYFPPITRIPTAASASIGGRSWDFDAHIVRAAHHNGVLYATGTENSGLSIFIQNDLLVFDYNYFGEHFVAESSRTVPTGVSTVSIHFRRGRKDANVTLLINGEACGDMYLPRFMRMMSSVGTSVGCDDGSPVSERYSGHFPFTGTIERIDVQLVSVDKTSETEANEAAGRSIQSRQ
jgi:arylsulfatase A-like enzyme